ncbi:lipopolysaccharide kinase InaA family protein [Pseudomonas aegrilactucae]|uniref:Phosphotransferase n=1 Tax=Pseudomonas aegrilactucae TaxID=2854028 RepID=A0A9Q3ACF0_9PSED|nr:lipopolysaccharide kinase InaA family protein [Pseudomonas aegrilactucae]MBV6286680.1 phosphotransferase [Pseudomonas aegrilactucae]
MRHLRNLISPLSTQCIEGVTFHFDPQYQDELATLVQRFMLAPETHKPLDVPEQTRGVFLLEGERKWVLKHNRLLHWKKQLQNYLGIKRTFGLHDLTNEFINLAHVSAKSAAVPRVAAFGHRSRFPFLTQEYLLVGFFDEHCSVDERLSAQPSDARALLPQVFQLFAQMLDDGFVHMDPHPKNILIAPDGRLRLIDFECCAHSVIDRDFSLGFLMGYFYHYWIQRYVALDDYREYCASYLASEQPDLNRAVFEPVFERFIGRKVSRTTRYSIFTDARAQAAFKLAPQTHR